MNLSFELWPNDPYSGMGVTGVPINSWGDKPIKECIDKVASYGYEGVDFFHEIFLKMKDKKLKQTRETLGGYTREKGLDIPSIGAHHLVLTDRDWEMEGQVELIKNAIDIADDIGANTVTSYVAGYYDPPTYKLITREKARKTLVNYARELCDYAGDRDLTFSLETHQGTLIDKPGITMEIVEEIDRENLRLTVDFGGLELGVKPIMPIEDALEMYKERLNCVHAKDIAGVIGDWNMCWFGGGLIDFKRYSKALQKIDYDGYVTVEWEGWFKGGSQGVGDLSDAGLGDMDKAAPESYKFMSKYFK